MSRTERDRRPGESDAAFARRLAQYEDEAAAYRAMLALDAGGMSSWRWDVASNTVTGDACWAEVWGVGDDASEVPLSDLFDRIHPDDHEAVNAEITASLQADEDYEVEFRVRAEADSQGDHPADACLSEELPDEARWRWLGGRGRVTKRSEDGAPLAMLGVNWDMTEQKRHEENLELLAGEMDHRVKNAFAVMRALVTIGERSATDLKSFAADLRAQIQAMADAHAVSARLARRKAEPRPHVPIGEVLRTALAPWIDGGAGTARIEDRTDGTAMLPARKVSSLAMLAYELATNAAKHGPLGKHEGELTVTVEPDPDDPSMYLLTWTENCADQPFEAAADADRAKGPTSGFGSLLIQHTIGALDARMHRELRPEGMAYEFRFAS